MSHFAGRTEQTRDDWMTPLPIVQSLGVFDLDPCASSAHPTRCARQGHTVADDGLSHEWHGRVWLNPPYGSEAKLWLIKLVEHGNGITLIPPRVGSAWFHEVVLRRASAIFFLKGRIAFLDANLKPMPGNNADSILVAYGRNNVAALEQCGLAGKLWNLTGQTDGKGEA